ncbi:MAG TPA: hypothetical protein VI756_06800 [Blastocatellia bacterium]
MSENIELKEPIFKLSVRFSNGELLSFIVDSPIDSRLITPDTRYAMISTVNCHNPNECTDLTVVNLRDVTFVRTERVTLDQLAAEHRMAGIRVTGRPADEKLKTLSYLKFI